jgi:hypothetical protein
MLKLFLLFITIFFINFAYSQDIEIYKKEKNDNYQLPKIHPEMTFEEFELLSQNIRMKDMMYATIVPGYIHFKAQQPKQAYWIMGIRGTSYITAAYVFWDANKKYGGLNQTEVSDKDKNKYQNLLIASISTATLTYLYDIIHGDHILHQKQEKIRYKYTIKLNSQTFLDSKNIHYPALGISVNF